MNITAEFITTDHTKRQAVIDSLVKEITLKSTHMLKEANMEKILAVIDTSIETLVRAEPDIESCTKRIVVKVGLSAEPDAKLSTIEFEMFRPVRNPILLGLWEGPIWTLVNHNKMLF